MQKSADDEGSSMQETSSGTTSEQFKMLDFRMQKDNSIRSKASDEVEIGQITGKNEKNSEQVDSFGK